MFNTVTVLLYILAMKFRILYSPQHEDLYLKMSMLDWPFTTPPPSNKKIKLNPDYEIGLLAYNFNQIKRVKQKFFRFAICIIYIIYIMYIACHPHSSIIII